MKVCKLSRLEVTGKNYFVAEEHTRRPSYSIARDRTTRKMAGIAVGLSKGHQVAKRTLAPRPAQRKGVRPRPFPSAPHPRFSGFPVSTVLTPRHLSTSLVQQKLGARVKNIRELIRDVVGSAPYEKRLMELLKVGRDKRALKLAKRKVRRRGIKKFLGFRKDSRAWRIPPRASVVHASGSAPVARACRGSFDRPRSAGPRPRRRRRPPRARLAPRASHPRPR
jgi:large subunit ribosomal protein L36e